MGNTLKSEKINFLNLILKNINQKIWVYRIFFH